LAVVSAQARGVKRESLHRSGGGGRIGGVMPFFEQRLTLLCDRRKTSGYAAACDVAGGLWEQIISA